MTDFTELGLNVKILKAIEDMGWTEATPVQKEAIPIGLEGRDILAQAQTGTGKTATYGTIILGRVPSGLKRPSAIVLCPTRELALQVEQELFKLSKYTKHRTAAIYGGSSYSMQFEKLKRGADIIIGTPGRVKDLIEKEVLDMSCIKEAVMDEADRMLDMGFEEEVNFIMDCLPKERHTMLFSATMADEIMRMGGRFMNDPMELRVSKDEPCSDLVSQYYIPVSRGGKRERLEMILSCNFPKTIIFCQTKSMVDELFTDLCETYKVGALHGDMPQMKREKVIRNFKSDRFQALIATDVAARGIDVNNVDVVVNYDAPPCAETYLHRIGRTGRAGKEGIAVSFVTKMEDQRIRMYERETGKKIKKMKVEDLMSNLAGNLTQRPAPEPLLEKRVMMVNTNAQRFTSEPVSENKATMVNANAQRFTSEPVQEKKVMMVIPPKTNDELQSMIALQINIGKEDGYGRVQISEFVKKNANLTDDLVGRVGLGSASSFIEVKGSYVEMTVKALCNKNLNGKRVMIQPAPKKVPYSEKECSKTARGKLSCNPVPGAQ